MEVNKNSKSVTNTEANKLCEACQQFEISEESFTSDSHTGQRMHQLGYYQDIFDRKQCPLCRLIAEAYWEGPLPHGPRSTASWTKDLRIQGYWCQPRGSDPNISSLQIFMIQSHQDRKATLMIRPFESGEGSQAHCARRITSALIDLEEAKFWLRNCEETHTCNSMLPKSIKRPALFKFVDVEQMCLVEAPEASRYLVLSYVWGTRPMFLTKIANLESLSTPGGLTHRFMDICPTIRDAIDITKRLGERYLWVDSLCIVQDGPEKGLVIQDMDLVYSQATAMICAADDKCQENGFPGVGHPRYAKQYVGEILPGLEVVAQYSPMAWTENTIYSTRGWT